MRLYSLEREKNISVIEVVCPSKVGDITYMILSALDENDICVELIRQSYHASCGCTVVFNVHGEVSSLAFETLDSLFQCIPEVDITCVNNAEKLSISGMDMRGGVNTAARALRAMWRLDTDILGISVSEMKISLTVEEKYADRAFAALLEEFELECGES